jgi:hypothetical protein
MSLIHSGLRLASDAPNPPNIMIMYFMVVPSSGAPLAGAGPRSEQSPRYSTSSTKIFFCFAGFGQRYLGAGEDVAVDLDVDAVLAGEEPADGRLPFALAGRLLLHLPA